MGIFWYNALQSNLKMVLKGPWKLLGLEGSGHMYTGF